MSCASFLHLGLVLLWIAASLGLWQPTPGGATPLEADSVGALQNVQITLLNASADTLGFAAPLTIVSEDSVSAAVTVQRVGGNAGTVSVNYATANGTAVAGADYVSTSGLLVFGPGQTSQTIVVPILNNNLVQEDRSFQVLLANPVGAALSLPSQQEVQIWDDDGRFEFVNAQQSQSEGWADNYLAVRWTGATNRAVSVDYVGESLTATAWKDFEGVTGTLTFQPGETVKSFFFRDIEDTLVELDEAALFRLRHPSFSTGLGERASIVFTILDNDAANGPGRGANWPILNLLAQPDGRILAAGGYNGFNGLPLGTVVRLNGDGSTDAGFRKVAVGWGDALALQADGKIIIGGGFGQVGGLTRGNIARLNPDGSVDPSFASDPGANAWVNTVALQPDQKVLLGGWFKQVNGTPQNYIARLETNGTVDVSFVVGTGPNAVVRAVAAQVIGSDTKILIGGDFTDLSDYPRGRLARLLANGSVDPDFDAGPGANGTVRAILPQPDGRILIAGDFTSYNGRARTRVARLTVDGLVDDSFDAGPVATWTVLSLALQPDGKILIGGGFSPAETGWPSKIARLNPDGNLDHTFQSPAILIDDWVSSIAVLPDNRIAIGGYFTSLGGIPRNRFAILNPDGTLAPDGSEVAPPAIRMAPVNVTTSVSMSPYLSVTADGAGLLSYQWRHDGVAIPGATSTVLDFGLLPQPLARWSFTGNLLDSVSGIPVTLANGASVSPSRLVLNGQGSYAFSAPLPFTLAEKTLEAWFSLDNPTVQNDIVGIEIPGPTHGDDVFDAIVLGEMFSQRWIAGSDYWRRTQFLSGPLESGIITELVHMAATYGADHRITLYRNGAPYGSSYKSVGEADSPREFPADLSQVVFGLRAHKAGNGFMKGTIDEVRLYDRALSAQELALSFASGPDALPPKPGPGPSVANSGDYDVIVSSPFGAVTSKVARVTFLSPDLVRFAPGTFILGSPDAEAGHAANESPLTEATLSREFWMSRYEVTQGEYLSLINTNPSAFSGDPSRPVEQVSWDDARQYCALLNAQEQAAGRLPAGYAYRLPTEAEWEYAARAGTITPYSFSPGDAGLSSYAWYAASSNLFTHPVGLKYPNPADLYDVHGNVWEWCHDWAGPYPGGSAVNPSGPNTGANRTARGGSFNSPALDCRSAVRLELDPSTRTNNVGFRIALAPILFLYTNDFEGIVGPEWSVRTSSVTPGGGRRFLGEFGNQTTRLTLTNLPPHTAAVISFDLFVIRSWDGNWTGAGPDVWTLQPTNSPILFRTTFNNNPPSNVGGQAFPGTYSGAEFPGRTGATENNSLGYRFSGNGFSILMDSVYHLDLTFDHSAGNLALNFAASGLQALTDESWGLDNVRLRVLDAPAGAFEFSEPLYLVDETAPNILITVNRIGGSLGVATVDYTTRDDTAQAGLDYLPLTGTLNFQDGETNKTLLVPIIDDGLPEGDEQFLVQLSNPTGGSVLGARSSVPVQIVDDDGYIEFTQTNVVVTEIGGWAQLSVRWTGSTNRTVSVRVQTVNGSASSVTDFFSQSFVLTFNPGQNLHTVSIPIREDGAPEPDETFTVVLTNPSVGAALRETASVSVLILDNDTTSGPGRGANWGIEALAVQSDDKVLLGGGFLAVNGTTRNRIARVNPDGSVDGAFNPGNGPNSTVQAIALQPDGRLIIGGWFTAVNSSGRNRIARLTASGGLDVTFNPGTGANDVVYELALRPDGKVLVAGTFTTLNGVSRNRLARLNANGTLDDTFNPGTGANGTVWALALQADGKILISGDFTTFNGTSRNRLARLNPDGSLDSTFTMGTGLNAAAQVITVLPDNKILLGGSFTTYNGTSRNRIIRLQPTGLIDSTFNPGSGPDNTVLALAVQADGKILVGGVFGTLNGKAMGRLGRLNPSGTLDTTFRMDTGANASVNRLGVLTDGRIVAGGNFTVMDGYNRAHLAFLNSDGTQPADPITWVRWNAAQGGNDHYYAFTSRPGNWSAAEAEAARYYGHLVSVNSAVEQNFLKASFLKGLNRIRPFHIGLSDAAVEGQFVWSSGEPLTFVNWGPGEPNNSGTQGEDYALMNANYARGLGDDRYGTWEDASLIYTFVNGNYATPYFGIMETEVTALPPMITNQPESQTLLAGATASFTVGLAGIVPATFQWFFNQTNALPNANGSTLSIPGVQPTDAGLYSVTISNGFGSTTSAPALLVVHVPPFITLQPQSLSSVTGSVASFTVGAFGDNPLAYQWRFNGAVLLGANTNTLTFDSVQPTHAGAYQLIVSNPYGSATSRVATLTVLIPPALTKQPVDAAVPLDAPVQFCVEATGTPPFQYQWRLNGVNLEGATESCFTIPHVQLWHGGVYSAIVSNPGGSVLSADARLTFTGLPVGPPAEDNFANRRELTGAKGIVSVNNLGATKEPAELDHAGKPGGSSVWYSWTAPAKGIATFRTTGSTFDTLLAVYSGPNLSNVVALASDEDRGGYLASQVSFNTQAGASYQIAIDGYAGGQGTFILSWNLEVTPNELPVIARQPRSLTVPRGSEALLSVEASGQDLRYQWTFNGSELAGATSPSLLLSNVQPRHLGTYTVRVTNPQLRTTLSLPAVLEIGLLPTVQSQDKLEDLFLDQIAPKPNAILLASVNVIGGISVRAGAIGSHTLNNSSSTNSGRAEIKTLCRLAGGERRWFSLHAEDLGVLTVDTQGSEIDTLLGVFTLGATGLSPVACDDDGAPDGKRSRVSLSAVPGTDYLIGVDGKGGETGVVLLNWSLGVPLSVRRQGSTLLFSWPASFAGFGLEESSSLKGALSWSAVGLPIPTPVNGTNNVSIPLGSATKFYRLRQP